MRLSSASSRHGCWAPRASADAPSLPPHEVHEDELAERHRVREVGLPAADRRDFLHELHEAPVPRQHERVDHDPRAPAQRHLTVSGLENLGIEAHGVDRKSTRLNSSHGYISYAVFCLKKKKKKMNKLQPTNTKI